MKRGPAPTWIPLRRQLLDSSIWEENAIICKLWVTLLIVGSEPGRRGTIDMTERALAARACMTAEEVSEALGVLMAPDPRSRSRVADGRRLELLEKGRTWGWRLVNWEAYERTMAAAGSTMRARERRGAIATKRNGTSRNVTEPTKEKEKEKDKEKEGEREPREEHASSAQTRARDEFQCQAGATAGPPLPRRTAPPSEDEWVAYSRKTWPDWDEEDIRAAWSYYERRKWPGNPVWKLCAKTCYHKRYQNPRRGSVARTLVGAHPAVPHPKPVAPAEQLPPSPSGGGVWVRVLEVLESSMDKRDFDTWFRRTRQVGEMNGVLRIAVDPLFGVISKEYEVQIHEACDACGVNVPIRYEEPPPGGGSASARSTPDSTRRSGTRTEQTPRQIARQAPQYVTALGSAGTTTVPLLAQLAAPFAAAGPETS